MTKMTKRAKKAPTGAGRPRLGEEAMKPRSVRMTDAQAEKLDRLGGGAWVRDRIDKAEDPAKQ